uniref:Putative rmlC-like jelly roll fold protein n=1 Tax=Helianthus annuus TaxID=4232 RepID=A0A251TKK8_HELAN
MPETYEYSQEQQFSGEGGRRGGGEGNQDRHQKVENLKEGDVVAIPTGTAHWLHNDGNTELVVVVFLDTQNHENQLDENQRVHIYSKKLLHFKPKYIYTELKTCNVSEILLSRKPSSSSSKPAATKRQPRQQSPQRQRQRQRQRQGQGQNAGNIFNGFTPELIAQSFNVDQETAQKLQGQNDQRGHNC